MLHSHIFLGFGSQAIEHQKVLKKNGNLSAKLENMQSIIRAAKEAVQESKGEIDTLRGVVDTCTTERDDLAAQMSEAQVQDIPRLRADQDMLMVMIAGCDHDSPKLAWHADYLTPHCCYSSISGCCGRVCSVCGC